MIIIISFSHLLAAACWSGKNGNSETNSASPDAIKDGGYTANLPEGFQMPDDDVGRKILKEYGAMFVARSGVVVPDRVVFKNTADVNSFQKRVPISSERIGDTKIELQTPAMNALKDAIKEARQKNLTITPRGADAARRSYFDTVKLWDSRVSPGLTYYARRGKISRPEAERIRLLSSADQVPEIFKLEEQGLFFSKDLTKPIMFSVAPPGSSQHLSLLALDISEHDKAGLRAILANHGWFQTVTSDLPHFTYLGVAEEDLPKLGLKKTESGGRTFWVPEI